MGFQLILRIPYYEPISVVHGKLLMVQKSDQNHLRLVVEIPLFGWFYVLLVVSSGVLVQVAPSPKQDTQGFFSNANLPSFQGLIRTRLSEGDFLGTPESRRQPKLFVFFLVGGRKFFFWGEGKFGVFFLVFFSGEDLLFFLRREKEGKDMDFFPRCQVPFSSFTKGFFS